LGNESLSNRRPPELSATPEPAIPLPYCPRERGAAVRWVVSLDTKLVVFGYDNLLN
jgi:hypothetical protein